MTPPDKNAELTALMEQTAHGNQQAFRLLARQLGPRMHGLAARLVSGNAAQAEDIVQEALIKLWQQAPKWQSGGSVSAYASRLVYTLAMDHHRRSRPTTSLDDGTLDIPEPETVTNGIAHQQARHLLLGAMAHLPERQQQAVTLAYFHEYRTAEVATALGTTEKAAESLLVRARKALAELLPAHLSHTFH